MNCPVAAVRAVVKVNFPVAAVRAVAKVNCPVVATAREAVKANFLAVKAAAEEAEALRAATSTIRATYRAE